MPVNLLADVRFGNGWPSHSSRGSARLGRRVFTAVAAELQIFLSRQHGVIFLSDWKYFHTSHGNFFSIFVVFMLTRFCQRSWFYFVQSCLKFSMSFFRLQHLDCMYCIIIDFSVSATASSTKQLEFADIFGSVPRQIFGEFWGREIFCATFVKITLLC